MTPDNWYTAYFNSLPSNRLYCVRGKDPNEEKKVSYCRQVKCPNLTESHALESKPKTKFGNNHPPRDGINIKLQ